MWIIRWDKVDLILIALQAHAALAVRKRAVSAAIRKIWIGIVRVIIKPRLLPFTTWRRDKWIWLAKWTVPMKRNSTVKIGLVLVTLALWYAPIIQMLECKVLLGLCSPCSDMCATCPPEYVGDAFVMSARILFDGVSGDFDHGY